MLGCAAAARAFGLCADAGAGTPASQTMVLPVGSVTRALSAAVLAAALVVAAFVVALAAALPAGAAVAVAAFFVLLSKWRQQSSQYHEPLSSSAPKLLGWPQSPQTRSPAAAAPRVQLRAAEPPDHTTLDAEAAERSCSC